MKTKQQIEDYYDCFITDWQNNSTFMNNSDPYLRQCSPGSGLLTQKWFDTMPEPFYGDADDNLVVTINLNPGYSDNNHVVLGRSKMSSFLSNGYSYYAKPFPYIIGKSPNPSGNIWWQSRHKSLLIFVEQINPDIKNGKSLPLPFDIELCPWHSPRWNVANVTIDDNVINSHIKPYVLDYAFYALQNSRVPYIIAVGKGIYDVLVKSKSLGFNIVKQWDQNSGITGWPQNKANKNIERSFSLLHKDGICVLCTWARPKNNLPSKAFYPIIQQFLQITITIGVVINNNYVQVVAQMDAADALRLLELIKQAEDTVLKSIPDDDRHLTFDPWLKVQDPKLYERTLAAFHKAFSIRLGESYAADKELYDQTMNVHVPCAVDDGYYLEDSNDVKFDSFEQVVIGSDLNCHR